jgi:VanZ like family
MYPFRIGPSEQLPHVVTAMLLNASLKQGGALDIFLNILLFMPFGFGLAEKIREGGGSRKRAFISALLAGAVFSYAIEFTQAFIPPRDSGWIDVFTNSTGSVLGFLLFEFAGALFLRALGKTEDAIRTWFSFRRLVSFGLIYFAIWFLISMPLQRQTTLKNWDANQRLVVGNDASGSFPWNGKVLQIQFWDRSLPSTTSMELSGGRSPGTVAPLPFASYELAGNAPFPDQRRSLSALAPPSVGSDPPGSPSANGSQDSWLQSEAPVAQLVTAIREANQFSVHLVCAPTGAEGAHGRILSISDPSAGADLTVQQADADLLLWFRHPLAAKSRLALRVPDVFSNNAARDLVFTYDGLYFSLYVGGRLLPRIYQLSPGTGLARFVRRPKTLELAGYRYIYYSLVFLPAGFLLGATFTRPTPKSSSLKPLIVGLFLVFPFLLEAGLAQAGQRAFSGSSLGLSFLFLFAGVVWVHADKS